MSATDAPPPGLALGERAEWYRRRRGLSRRELAELLGRDRTWVQRLETEGRGADQLSNLIDLARALRLKDLSSLAGYQFSATALEVPEHPAVPVIRQALIKSLLAPVGPVQTQPLHVLRRRVEQGWTAWNVSRNQYTALGVVLPDLLRDAIGAARQTPLHTRREAHALLVHVYLLAQRFAYGVRSVELAAQCTDRALLAADTADDPLLVALAGWAGAMTSLTADRPEEAEATALQAARHVARLQNAEETSLHGALLLFAAMGAASSRQAALAWRHWDAAAADAEKLGSAYQDPRTMFGQPNVGIYAVALNVECGNASAAVAQAGALDPAQMLSSNRRAHHWLDAARGYQRTGDLSGMRGALAASEQASHETLAYSPDGRRMVADLVRNARQPDEELTRLGSRLGLL